MPGPRHVLLVLTAVIAVFVLGTPGAASAAEWHKCGSVAFEPNTDWGASNIRALRTTCRTARSVARGTKDLGGGGRYRINGFWCRGVASEPEYGLPFTSWSCHSGKKLVRFRTS